MKKIILLIALLTLSQLVTAADKKNYGYISRYYADDNGTVYIKLNVIDYNGCTPSQSNHYYTLRSEGTNAHPRFEELFAMVMLHAETQRVLTFTFNDLYCEEFGNVAENSPLARITVNFE